jgi:hypothetical protein
MCQDYQLPEPPPQLLERLGRWRCRLFYDQVRLLIRCADGLHNFVDIH